ncbi:MAG: hypothetical protein H6577_13925 [Lewinellaceae bacterium]|nr:hypothetical protein [Saprospiraceae bacterium]MCB9339225.1 hypothetical protein [Lewinellaceae bacterium]
MKAIEVNAHIDGKGNIKLPSPLKVKDKDVKIIVLIPEDDDVYDDSWLKGLSANPAFGFLNEPEEDIYNLNDGTPIINEV